MQSKSIAVVVISSILAACSVSQQSTPAQVDLDTSVAKTQVSALTAAVSQAQAQDGVALTQALSQVGNVASALVPAGKRGARAKDLLVSTSNTCACAAGATSCTFEACSIGPATVSGAVSFGDGVVSCQGLTLDIATAGSGVGKTHVALDCSLTYTDGSVAGTLHTTGSSVVDGVTYSWNATLTANAVTFSASTVTGGNLDVSTQITVSSTTEDDKTYAAAAKVALP
jgi:hypothetical protein